MSRRKKASRSAATYAGVRAIALDTNAFSYGHLNVKSLRALVARAKAHGGVEVWIPEVALWEWADHAASQRQAAIRALELTRPTGLPAPQVPPLKKHEVYDQLRAAVAALGAPILLVPTADVAVEALKDQIFVAGPARTVNAKDGRIVKVGAADSALLRSLLHQAGGDTAAFVLVTSDKDVDSAFKQIARRRTVRSV